MIKIECYKITIAQDERNSELFGYFINEADGLKAAEGKGWYGSSGSSRSVTLKIYEDIEEFKTEESINIKQQALDKLSNEEKRALGLIK